MDNKISYKRNQNSSGSCRLWGQAHGAVGPDQSLSCPHSAQSRSRDQPIGIGQPPGEAEVGCGSGWGKDTES